LRYAGSLEKSRDIDIEKNRDLMQLAGGNAVRPLFVFLDLLESQSECFAKLELGNTAKSAKLSYVATNDNINRIWHFITL